MENLKLPEEKKESSEAEEELEEIKFDPDKRPGIPRGAGRKGGHTVFHKRLNLWDVAKLEHDKGTDHGAVKRYESYANWMNHQYKILGDSFDAADKALEKAGLDESTQKGRNLFEKAREDYIKEHSTEWSG